MSINGTMMQFFHWHAPADGSLWQNLAAEAATLAASGITALWVPPAYKAASADDAGYGTYDLFDLGEFHQKNTLRTRWGTRQQFLDAVAAAHREGMQIYLDAVLNHKHGADGTEIVDAVAVDKNDRNNPPPGEGQVEQIGIWSRFDFPDRRDCYSAMKWNASHFDATDYDHRTRSADRLWRLNNKRFDTPVDREKGNYDYLIGCDIDMDSDEVRTELKHWGRWIVETTGVDGFRIDAVKHIRFFFFNEWLDDVRAASGQPVFAVGEYYDSDIGELQHFLNVTGRRMSLFDFALQERFYDAGRGGGAFPMRDILRGTLAELEPEMAVTFVENHDTQDGRHEAKPVEPWFKPLAYALILLRAEGYPCIFQPDYFGADYVGQDGRQIRLHSHRFLIDRFLAARRDHAYGPQIDYFDHDNVVGWTRLGDTDHPSALAVLMSDGPGGQKWMDTGRPGGQFRDITDHSPEIITCNSDGWGEFTCPDGSVSVWIPV